MNVYRDRILVDKVPDRRKKPGELFSRLVGVNVSTSNAVSSDGSYLEPIYMPLAKVQRGEGSVVIWINDYKRPRWMVFLRKRWPWVQIFKYDWMILED